MNKSAPTLLVSVTDQLAIIKIVGRATVASSVSFKRLVNELRDRGFQHFILDLSECATMDSTFLGVLAATALKATGGTEPSRDSGLELLNPNDRVAELLDNLGVAHLFRTSYCPVPNGSKFTVADGASSGATREEISRTCLEAHQLLMQINPDNVPKFKDVTQFLAEDLKKLGSAS